MTFSKDVIDILNNSNNVAICCHIKPDADCLGSASALKSALLKLGKSNIDIFVDDEVNDNYMFLPHINKINPIMGVYDTIIAVDCGDASRVGKYITLFEENENTISIDHHLILEEKFTKFLENDGLSSAAETIYHLVKQLNIEMDNDIATGLYAGIASDTGGFMHANSTAEVHFVIGDIMKYLTNVVDINYYLFKRRTLGQIGLLKTALNNINFICDNKVAITYLTYRDFERNNSLNSETFGIVDYCVNIDGIEIGILISEKSPNLYSCSLRGRNRNVAVIAEHFGGGGHALAAGCNIFGGYKSIISKIEKVIIENYDRICKC